MTNKMGIMKTQICANCKASFCSDDEEQLCYTCRYIVTGKPIQKSIKKEVKKQNGKTR